MSNDAARAIAIAGWVAVAVAFVTIAVVARRSQGRFPSLVDIARQIVRRSAGRWLLVLVWLWIGFHVFVRHG